MPEFTDIRILPLTAKSVLFLAGRIVANVCHHSLIHCISANNDDGGIVGVARRRCRGLTVFVNAFGRSKFEPATNDEIDLGWRMEGELRRLRGKDPRSWSVQSRGCGLAS